MSPAISAPAPLPQVAFDDVLAREVQRLDGPVPVTPASAGLDLSRAHFELATKLATLAA